MRNYSGETCFECLAGEKYCHVYTTEKWCKTKIEKWMKKYPGKFKGFRETEDGAYFIQIPAKSMRSFTFKDFEKRKGPNINDEKRKEIICKAQMGRLRKKFEAVNMDETEIQKKLKEYEKNYWAKYEEELEDKELEEEFEEDIDIEDEE